MLRVFTMSHCSALRVKDAVRMYGPRLPNDVTLLGFAFEGRRSILCALPRRGDVTMLGPACEGRHSLLCASSPGDVTLSILCSSLPDDVTLLGSAREGSNSILCTSPSRDVTKLDSVCNYCKGHRSSLSATRYVSLPLATLSRERRYNKRHPAVSPT